MFGFVRDVVGAIRRFRKSHALRDSLSLAVRVSAGPAERDVLESLRPEVERLANVSTLRIEAEPTERSGSARLMAGGAQLLIDLTGILDPEDERARIRARLSEVESDATRSTSKLGNEGFLAKAPAEVVELERRRLAEAKEEAASLAEQLAELG